MQAERAHGGTAIKSYARHSCNKLAVAGGKGAIGWHLRATTVSINPSGAAARPYLGTLNNPSTRIVIFAELTGGTRPNALSASSALVI